MHMRMYMWRTCMHMDMYVRVYMYMPYTCTTRDHVHAMCMRVLPTIVTVQDLVHHIRGVVSDPEEDRGQQQLQEFLISSRGLLSVTHRARLARPEQRKVERFPRTPDGGARDPALFRQQRAAFASEGDPNFLPAGAHVCTRMQDL